MLAIAEDVFITIADAIDVARSNPRMTSPKCLWQVDSGKELVEFRRANRSPDRKDTIAILVDSVAAIVQYLSQLERGDAQRPAPDKLQTLAAFYGVPYEDLLREAGYLHRDEKAETVHSEQTSAVHAALMSANLTPEEEAAVVKYIQFLRFQSSGKK